jgi:hypothetical protein
MGGDTLCLLRSVLVDKKCLKPRVILCHRGFQVNVSFQGGRRLADSNAEASWSRVQGCATRILFKWQRNYQGKYGNGSESIGYGRSGNVRLARKIILNSQRVECYVIKEHRRRARETMRLYRNRSTSSFCISSCLNHINVINILDLV